MNISLSKSQAAIKKILLVLFCLQLFGCAASPRKSSDLELQMSGLQYTLGKKNEEINTLQELLKKKEEEIKEKDAKIDELRKKLESLGVFVQ